MGMMPAAMECHKIALQYAVRSGDKGAEALALANLGATGTKQGDLSTARVCVERHLELSTNLHDSNSTCEAYEQLGLLACRRGDFSAAAENFLLALDVAVKEKNQVRAKQMRCRVGYAMGMMKMEETMKGTASAMGAAVTH
jgi:Tfp pilus assembly protein PilF